MIIAVPVAVLVALFLTQYAPKRLAAPFGYLIDLLAAVPSIVYGLWGLQILREHVVPVQNFLNKILGWTNLFQNRPTSAASSWPRSCWRS